MRSIFSIDNTMIGTNGTTMIYGYYTNFAWKCKTTWITETMNLSSSMLYSAKVWKSNGQKKIETPNIDRMAAEGMRLTQYYAGSAVCAPSRCCLMTGQHGGHAFVRANCPVGGKGKFPGQLPLPEGTQTVASLLKEQGYVTGAFGKWGLGNVDSTGDPLKMGFDTFVGYNC